VEPIANEMTNKIKEQFSWIKDVRA
jgi:hypothetical protein